VKWWAWLLVGLFAGAIVGYFTAALMTSASMRDSM
jgi:gas vesicle protein